MKGGGIKNPDALELQDVLADLKRHVWDSSAMPPKMVSPKVATILGYEAVTDKKHPLARKATNVGRKGGK